MAFGLKYKAQYKQQGTGLVKEIRISKEGYVGSVTEWETANAAPVTYRKGDDGAIFGDPIKSTTATLQFKIDYQLEVIEFLEGRQLYRVEVVYVGSGQVEFVGWVEPYNGGKPYGKAPHYVTLTASCGLSQLKKIRYTPATSTTIRTQMQVLTDCLNLTGNTLTIHAGVYVREANQPNEARTLEWIKVNTNRYFSEEGERDYCYPILADILDKYNAEIVQENGAWYIRPIAAQLLAQATLDTYVGGVYVESFTMPLTQTVNNAVRLSLDGGQISALAPVKKHTAEVDFTPMLQGGDNLDIKKITGGLPDGWTKTGFSTGYSGVVATPPAKNHFQLTGSIPHINGAIDYSTNFWGKYKNKPKAQGDYITSPYIPFEMETDKVSIEGKYETSPAAGAEQPHLVIIGVRAIKSDGSGQVWLKPDGSWDEEFSFLEFQPSIGGTSRDGVKSEKGTYKIDADTEALNSSYTRRRSGADGGAPVYIAYNRIQLQFYRIVTKGPNFFPNAWVKHFGFSTNIEKANPFSKYNLTIKDGNSVVEDDADTVNLMTGDGLSYMSGTLLQFDGVTPTGVWKRFNKTEGVSLLRTMLADRLAITYQPSQVVECEIAALPTGAGISYLPFLIFTDLGADLYKILRYEYDDMRRIATVTAAQVGYGDPFIKQVAQVNDSEPITKSGRILADEENTGELILPNTTGGGAVKSGRQSVEDLVDDVGEYGDATHTPNFVLLEDGTIRLVSEVLIQPEWEDVQNTPTILTADLVHLQAGNAFGAPSRIGTTDSQPVQIITNNTNRVTVSETGNVAVTTGSLQVFDGLNARYYGKSAGTGNPITALLVGNGLGGSQTLELGGGTTQGEPVTALRFRSGTAGGLGAGTLLGQWNTAALTVNTLLQSTVADGTAPMQVASLTKVVNLNADLLDGQHGLFYQDAGNINAGTLNIARHPNSPAGAGTGTKITFNASGHPTLIETPTTLAGYGITDAVSSAGSYVNPPWLVSIPASKVTGLPAIPTIAGTANYLPKFTAASALGNSLLYDTGTRIGLGTTDPQATLHVRGNMWVRNASDGAYLGLSATAAGGAILDFNNTAKLHFRYNEATNIATISSTGVGINTPLTVAGLITSTVANGSAPMQVASLTKVVNLNADLLDGQHGPFYQDAGNINAGTLNIARHPLSGVAAGTYRSVTVNASGHVTAASNPTTLAGYGITDALTPGTVNYVQKSTGTGIGDSQIFDNGTAVGVGTNSPQAFLDVRGPMWVRQADTSYFSVDSTTSGGVKLDFNNTTKLGIGYNGGARIATFTNTGRTGFGTTDPQATVDVRGNMWVRNPSDASYFSVTPTSAGGVQLHAGNTGKLHLGYNDTTNILTVWGGGANRVGINKETPSEALDVVGNVLSSGDIKAGAYLVSSQTLYSTPQTTGGRVAILDGSGNVKASRSIETIAATDAAATISGAWTFSTVPTITGTPSGANDAVSKSWVEAQVTAAAGGMLPGQSVHGVTVSNITLSGIQNINGTTGAVGKRYLLLSQTDPKENGIWIMASGAWSRSTFYDTGAEISYRTHYITEGNFMGSTYVNTNSNSAVIGTTAIYYTLLTGGELDPTVPAWVKAITSDQAANLAYMVRTNGTYANPAWLTSLAASKLTGADEILSLNNVAALSPTGVPFKQDGTWSITGGIPQSQTPALTAFLANSNAGYITRKGDGTFASRTYQAGTGIAITYPAGQEGNSVWSLAPTGVAPVTSGPYQFDGFGRLVAKRAIDFTLDIINIPEILGGSDKRPPTFAFSTLTAIAGSSFAFTVDVAAAKTSYHAMSDITITRITATSGAINFNYDPATKILALNGTIPGAGSFSVNIEAKDNLNNNGGGAIPIMVVPPGGGEEVLACSARVLLAELYGFSKVHDLSRRSARFGWSGPATGTIGSIRWKTFTQSVGGGSQANVTVQAESYQSGNPEGNSTQFITLSSPTAHYTNYTVNVSQAGTFKLNFFHACADSTNSLKYQVNGGTIVTKTLTNTGGWDNFVTSSDSDITLNAGANTIKLMGGGSSVKIDYFTLKYPAGGGGGVVRTLYDTGTVPGNGDRPVVDFNKEHLPGVNYIFEIQGETCTSTPDETSIVIPDDGYTLRAELWNNDGSGLNGKISDITPGGSYDLPEAGWELIMVVEGIQHNNYSTSLEKKQSDGSYQIRYGEGTVQVGSSKTSGAYELFGSGNNLTRAVPGSPLNEGVYRYTFSPYQGGLKQREYIIDFTLIKTVVEGTPSAAAYFYDDTNNAIKGQITSGQSFSLPTSWDVQYTTNHTDVSHIDMILNKTGVGQVFVNGSDLTPFAQTTSYLFNPGQLSDSSNLNFENPTPLREGSYTLQVALRKNNAVFRTDTYLFNITSTSAGTSEGVKYFADNGRIFEVVDSRYFLARISGGKLYDDGPSSLNGKPAWYFEGTRAMQASEITGGMSLADGNYSITKRFIATSVGTSIDQIIANRGDFVTSIAASEGTSDCIINVYPDIS